MAPKETRSAGSPPLPPAGWTDGCVLANNIRIHYWRTGGNKPVLLLAHGFSDDGLCWTEFAKELAADYDIIMPDARGHGLSDPPSATDSMDAQCEDLAGLIQELSLDDAILMGHSMGSSSVAWFASRYPEIPRAVVLEDPRLAPWPAGGPGRNANPADVEERRRRILAQNNQPYADLMAECVARNPLWERAECEWWAPSKRRYHPDLVLPHPGKRPPPEETLPKIAAPTLILKADAQGALRQQNEAAAALLPNGRIVHVADAGHCVRRDQKAAALGILRTFLADL